MNEAPASSWQTDGKVNAIVVGNGKIYIGGSFTHVRAPGAPAGGAVRNHLAALDLHTGALKPWNPGANDIVNALAAKPNGKTIYVGGHFTKVHGATRLHVAAVSATASTVRPWKANTNGKVDVIKATRSRIYIGGTFTVLKGQTRNRLGAVSAASSAALINWKPHASSEVYTLQLSASGKRIYVGGAFDHMNGKLANHLSAIKTAKRRRSRRSSTSIRRTRSSRSRSQARRSTSAAPATAATWTAVNFKTSARRWNAVTDGDVRAITLRQGIVYVGGHFNNYCAGRHRAPATRSSATRRSGGASSSR